MKPLLSILTILLVFGCNQPQDEVISFIPGVYARYGEDEFTKGYDTLAIAGPQETGSQVFQITKRQRFQKTIEGKQLPEQYKVTHLLATYSPESKILIVSNSGQVISFFPSRNELRFGVTSYRKIK